MVLCFMFLEPYQCRCVYNKKKHIENMYIIEWIAHTMRGVIFLAATSFTPRILRCIRGWQIRREIWAAGIRGCFLLFARTLNLKYPALIPLTSLPPIFSELKSFKVRSILPTFSEPLMASSQAKGCSIVQAWGVVAFPLTNPKILQMNSGKVKEKECS